MCSFLGYIVVTFSFVSPAGVENVQSITLWNFAENKVESVQAHGCNLSDLQVDASCSINYQDHYYSAGTLRFCSVKKVGAQLTQATRRAIGLALRFLNGRVALLCVKSILHCFPYKHHHGPLFPVLRFPIDAHSQFAVKVAH